MSVYTSPFIFISTNQQLSVAYSRITEPVVRRETQPGMTRKKNQLVFIDDDKEMTYGSWGEKEKINQAEIRISL